MEDSLKNLISERGLVKASLTRFKKFFDSKNISTTLETIQERLDRAIPLYDKFDKIQGQIEMLVEGTNTEQTQSAERDSFEMLYFELIPQAKTYISRIGSQTESTQSTASSGQSVMSSNNETRIHLPTIKLAEFDGSYDMWLKFRDTFESLIHTNSSLTDIQRFHYLDSALKGDAARIIQSLGISSANYAIAWQSLKDRYENPQALIDHHIAALFELPSSVKESHVILRRLAADCTSHLHALKTLGEPTDAWDSLIMYLLETKLDAHTKREWQRGFLRLVKPRLKDMYVFLEEHAKYLERTVTGKQSSGPQQTSKPSNKRTERVAANVATNTTVCGFCKGKHSLYACESFKKLTPHARVDETRKLKYCFNCLQPGHQNKACTRGSCKRCNKKHHTLLHLEQGSSVTSTSGQNATTSSLDHPEAESTKACTAHIHEDGKSHVLLSTAIVYLQDRKGQGHECRVLLDPGSQSHFLTKTFCQRLNLPCNKIRTAVSGIGLTEQNVQERTKVELSSREGTYKTTISCLILPTITDYAPNVALKAASIPIPENIVLADPNFARPGRIDMLIGAGLFWDLLCVGQYKPGHGYPLLQKTLLGWILAGTINLPAVTKQNRISCNLAIDKQLHDKIATFWNIENVDSMSSTPSLDDTDICEQHFQRTTTRDKDGRFVVSIPWTQDLDKLGDSRQHAYKRLLSMERKLRRQTELHVEYLKFMNEYEALGHMHEVTLESNIESGYFLPHHAVIKADSTTTKVRVVFDGSAKTTTGLSLNDVQRAGPTVQQDLFSILIRFRLHRYVLSADVEKMYRQVRVRPEDCKFQRILWRSDSTLPVKTYELRTVTYGTASAPFLATRSLRQIGEDFQERNPVASRTIVRDFYVDDLLTGTNSIEEAITLREDLTSILATAGFQLRKWTSNNPQILGNEETNLQLPTEGNQDPKTLGVRWMTTKDELRFSVKKSEYQRITKRTILSEIAQIFDPLGLVGPATIQAKIIMQKLWQLEISWDESLPQDIHSAWINFRKELNEINQIIIPRRTLANGAKHFELHGFCDASERAYGACIYLRALDRQDCCTVRLMCAKSRVAPLKSISLPRLELCGALLLAQLMYKVKGAIDMEIHNEYYWCDSSITLTWIHASPSRWQTFVANRTTEIQRLAPKNWRHVPSASNPADIISRGVTPSSLLSARMWWNGPAWLSRECTDWPNAEPHVYEVPEQKQSRTVLVSNVTKSSIITKFSSFTRLIRVVAYCLRFVGNIRLKLHVQSEITRVLRIGPLSVTELEDAKVRLIKIAQVECFASEIRDLEQSQAVSKTSSLITLNPFLDRHGLIRVGGRLLNASISFEQRHPVILPSRHHLTTLIIRHEHQQLLHAGCQLVISSLRRKYWPLSCKPLVKKEIKQCMKCYKVKPLASHYIMGDLPAARVTATRPFYTCGLDYAGPFLIKEKTRSRVSIKAYLCVFVCFATKAIHLELATDLSTDAFLNCLHRFIARRGKPKAIFSDNGTNFIGAKNELKELGCLLSDKIHERRIADKLSKDCIQWHMIPPHAPHFGGLWESAVKSAKYHLRRVIGETKLTFEELYTLLTQVEACLNSRPLTPLSDDPNDLVPLTPGHFLIGDSMTSIPQPDLMQVPVNRLNRYQHLRKMFQDFWRRWHVEYLHQLQQRTKWKVSAYSALKIGSLVLLKDENLPPMRWKLGRITDLHPGKDNVTRVVSVQVADGIFKRPVAKICVLPVDTEDTITTQAPHNQPSNQDTEG